MRKCRHPIKKLGIVRKETSDTDGYGGEIAWEWQELECFTCGKSTRVKEEHTVFRLDNERYAEVTGRRLNFTEIKKIFQQNRDLFHNLTIDSNLKEAVLEFFKHRTPELASKIRRKEKLIAKHVAELNNMKDQYQGYE